MTIVIWKYLLDNMEIILTIPIFAIIIFTSFMVGAIFASRYILYLLDKEGYKKTIKENTNGEELNKHEK